MTTTFDIENVLYIKLSGVSSLTSTLSGSIRKNLRPPDSKKEDVVINSLPVANQQLQLAVANVNVFVPDKTVSDGGVQTKVVDHERLKTLTGIVISALNDILDGDYYYEVQQQTLIQDKESESHYSNIRINFYSINLN